MSHPDRSPILDHVGLVAGRCEALGMGEAIDRVTRPHPDTWLVTTGDAVHSMTQESLPDAFRSFSIFHGQDDYYLHSSRAYGVAGRQHLAWPLSYSCTDPSWASSSWPMRAKSRLRSVRSPWPSPRRSVLWWQSSTMAMLLKLTAYAGNNRAAGLTRAVGEASFQRACTSVPLSLLPAGAGGWPHDPYQTRVRLPGQLFAALGTTRSLAPLHVRPGAGRD